MEARFDKYMKEGNREKAEEFRLIDPQDKSVYMSAQCFKDNIVSVARQSTYHFYDTVIKAILQMYNEAGVPLKTFNTGGDEVPYGAWSQSHMAQKLIQTLPEIKDPIQLQGYFLEKVVDMLSSYNIQISGWEEIVLNKDPSGIPVVNTKFVNKNVLPLVWDNTGANIDLGNRIANTGYPIILCNVTNLYLDLAYDTDPFETGLYWGGFTNNIDPYLMTPMNVYHSTNYNFWGDLTSTTPTFPKKEKLNSNAIKNIKGLQAQLWSETITEGEPMMEYFILPKLFGFAERAWSKAEDWEENEDTQQRINGIYKGWANFTKIIGLHHLPRLDYLNGGYNYRISPPGAKVMEGSVSVNSEFPSLIIRYTEDGSEPNKNSPIFPQKLPYSNSIKVKAFNSLGKPSKTFLVQ
jgi:hexosaminidase